MEFNLKRPKRVGEESEEDLIKFQEDFLKNKLGQPAAKVVKTYETDTGKKIEEEKLQVDFDADNQSMIAVLGEVVEKPLRSAFKESQVLAEKPFPQVEKLNLKELASAVDATKSEKKQIKSLFAQNLERQGKLKSFFALNQVHMEKQDKLKEIMEKNSVVKEKCANKQIITGEGLGSKKEVEQIHLENLEILSKLKPDEVLKEQQKIVQQLDPKLVAFIKRRGKEASETGETKNQNEPSTKQPMANEQVLSEEILDRLPIKPNKKWLNMDKIEYDKLEWMLKPTKAQSNRSEESVAARFDFEGKVLAPDADVPVTKALHHHGNEPDAPGYTLDELFHLARSKFAQQRVLAIQTLGNILSQCHLGTYHQIIKSQEAEEKDIDEALDDKNNLLNQLIDGGILFLLRWNLDDQTESIINASLNALRHLVQPDGQENALDLVFDLNRGQECPSLHPFSPIFSEEDASRLKVDKNLNVSEKQDLNELKDDEFIRHDLIRGLFRMNLMERFVYLLGKYKPCLASSSIQQNIFLILYRCVRHSSELCFQFVDKHGNLLDLIVKQFLPLFVSHKDNALNVTLTNAAMSIKFLRLICSSGSNLAMKLYEKYELNQVLVNYLTVDTYVESSSVLAELTQLQLESVRLVKVLLTVCANTNQVARELVIAPYEVLLKKTLSLLNRMTTHHDNESTKLLLQTLIGLFDTLVLSMHEDDADLKLKYEISTNLFDQIGQFVTKQLKQESQEIDFDLMSVCVDYLVDFVSKLDEIGMQSKAENVHHKFEQTDALIDSIVHPVLRNQLRLDQLVMSRLMSHSTSQTPNEPFEKIRSNNLSYLPTISNVPNELSHCPFAFMASFVRLVLLSLKSRCKSVDIKLVRHFLHNDYLKSYLRAFNKKGSLQTASSFLKQKYENHFVYYLLKLALNVFALQDEDKEDANAEFDQKKFFYSVALSLLCQLKCGDECYAYDLIACFLFNVQLWSQCLSDAHSTTPANLNVLIRHFEQLNLSEKIVFKQHGQQQHDDSDSSTILLNKNTLSKLQSVHIFDNLNQIKFTYLDTLFPRRQLDFSRQLVLNKVQLRSLFTSELNSNQVLFKADWIYWPIVNELRKIELSKRRSSEFKAMTRSDEAKLVACISNCLKYIYLLEAYHGDYLDSSLSHTRRYVRLLYVYLFDSEVFLDRQIVTYLYLILFKYANDTRRPLEKLNFAEKIDEIISFYDFYQNLLTHYDAVSFGDYVFSLYVIVPLQQVYNVKYRQLFWSDFSHLFKFIKFNDDNAKLILPLVNFTQPNERSLHLIRLYSQLLLDVNDFRLVEQSRFAYAILVSHLNSFIFEHIDSAERHVEYEFKKLLIERFSSLQNQKLKNDLITFKSVNPKTNAIEFYDQLPSIRAQWLAQFNFQAK